MNHVSAWDDFPVHQSSEFIRHPATSDRNFYDRYYFNLHGSSDELFAIFGLGQYPNLGVTDAFIDVRHGDTQHIVRASAELGDRMDTRVGPIRVEVLKPLERVRVIVEPTEHSVAMDVTWTGAMPAHDEPRQYLRSQGKVVFDTQRFAQTGCWEGTMTVGGQTFEITPDRWWGTRDRSWGVRPVGEPEPDGIRQGTHSMEGMWNYFPMQFQDHSILYIVNEHVAPPGAPVGTGGARVLEEAVRIWHGDGREEWLGRPEWEHRLTPGTRLLAGSVIRFPDAPGGAIEVTCTPLMTNFLSLGTGYGMDADWRHGMYQGPLKVQGLQLSVPEIWPIAQFGVVDHVGRFEYGDHIGYGLYEQAFIGAFPAVGLNDAHSGA